jgi:hypothetical protein
MILAGKRYEGQRHGPRYMCRVTWMLGGQGQTPVHCMPHQHVSDQDTGESTCGHFWAPFGPAHTADLVVLLAVLHECGQGVALSAGDE